MAVIGTCTTMCPKLESLQRKKTKRLSIFEVQVIDGTYQANDLTLCVKEYSRCAAGTVRSPNELRTPATLVKTTNHLLSLLDVYTHCKSWLATTNFISDRLRAVRQDIIIQQLPCKVSILILEKIVRYHIMITFILYIEKLHDFDPTMNEQILLSYIGDLLEYYHIASNEKDCHSSDLKNFDEFKAYYILLNLKHSHVLIDELQDFLIAEKRHLDLQQVNRTRRETAMSVALSYHNKNYYRFFKSISKLRFKESCCLLYFYSEVRFLFLDTLNHAYNSKHLYFTLEKFTNWFNFDTSIDSGIFIEQFEVECKDNKIYFSNKNKNACIESERDKQEFMKKFSYMGLVESREGGDLEPKEIVDNVHWS